MIKNQHISSFPLLIDTDAGTDDAIAIIMALMHGSCDVVGITTVTGNIPLDKVVQNVLYLVEACGSDTPVYAGAAQPLIRKVEPADFIHGADGLGDIGLDLLGRNPAGLYGAYEIVKKANEYAGELTLITLGPMTNLAIALCLDPEVATKIKKCYVMGGLFQLPGNITPVSEFNFWADPEATKICLHSGLSMTMIGWDATLAGGYLTLEDLKALKEIPSHIAQISVDMQNVKLQWLKQNQQEVQCNLADPLAMAILLNPDIIEDEDNYFVDIITSHDTCDTRGQLIVDVNHQKGKLPNVNMVKKVNHELFKKTLFEAYQKTSL